MHAIELDGSMGEGGGQILRTALALSVTTGKAFRVRNIRAGRAKPGLMRQHLACVEAAQAVGQATVSGAALRSTELAFAPGGIVAGCYEFRIGSAGSASLLVQTVMPPLSLAGGKSELIVEGGTHNPMAPPFPFFEKAFLPLVRRLGWEVEMTLDRAGFYPNGGGRVRVAIHPAGGRGRLVLPAHGPAGENAGVPRKVSARVCLAAVARHVAERELAVVQQGLGVSADDCRVENRSEALGAGNTVHVEMADDGYSNVVTAFGEERVLAERVAEKAVADAKMFLKSGAAVEEHLADQLLVPMCLAGGGEFTTTAPTEHLKTNIEVIQKFLARRIEVTMEGDGVWRVRVDGGS